MLLRSSSSPIPILGSINSTLKKLEPESSLRRCKSAKLLSSSCAFGPGSWELEAELHKSPPKSFKAAHKIAVVVDSMGSEKPSISGRKNHVLRPGGGVEREGSGTIRPMARNSQSVSGTEDGAMYIATGFGIGGGNHEVSRADTVSDCTEVYYKKMLEANPGSSLLLRNYAKFLLEVQGNLAKAEEYYERAIVASPGDGEVLSLYAKLMWEVRRDVSHAEAYFDQAVQANPDDWGLCFPSWHWMIWVTCWGCLFGSFVLGSYAHFLWDTEEGEAGDTDSETRQRTAAPVMFYNSATVAVV